MNYLENSRDVDFTILEEKGIYPNELLQALKKGNYAYLNRVEFKDQRSDANFMEPLLHAVKKENKTYAIYKFFGDNLQEDRNFAILIIVNEPELIKGTKLSNNPTLMREFVEINPEIIPYMSSNLKNNKEFIEDLSKINDSEISTYIAQECKTLKEIIENPELAHNLDFMSNAIKENPSIIEHAGDELKNNYEFMQKACKENSEVINYITEHTESFGKEGLTAVQEVLAENVTCRAIEETKTELEIVQADIKNMELQEGFDEKSEEYKQLTNRARQLSNNMKFFEQIESGEIDHGKAARIINRFCKDLREDYKQELIKYFKLEDAIIAKEKTEKSEVKVEPKDIEKVSEDVKLSDLPTERKAIEVTIDKQAKEDMEETKMQQTDEKSELGERE